MTMKKNSNLKITTLILLIFYCSPFFSQKKHPLRDVAGHYKELGETEKFKAALFLLKNMSIHKSIGVDWYQKSGEKLPFSEFNFDDYPNALNYIQKNKATAKLRTSYDKEQLSVSFLIKNIDDAFSYWKTKPWSKHYSFNDFCEYILPYKSQVEPLEDWRALWQDDLFETLSNHENESDPVQMCTYVLNQIQNFGFVIRRKDPQPVLTSSQMQFRRDGTCVDLTNTSLLANRSIGIATTIDFTPHFGASSGRHFWNTVINSENQHIPFNGRGGHPYAYDANFRRLGKVLRITYSKQKSSLATLVPKNQIPTLTLQNSNFKDVTSEYVDVADITYNFLTDIGTKTKFLNVYNKGRWRVLWWGETDANHRTTYKNMGKNLVYLPSQYNYLSKADKHVYERFPILLNTVGKTIILKPDFSKTYSGTISRRNQIIAKNNENNTFEFADHKKLHLLYFDKTWQFSGTYTVENESITVKKVPTNALFKLIPDKPDGFERIFTINPKTNQMVWY